MHGWLLPLMMGQTRSWEDRVGEYIDSPFMKHRLRLDDKLIARIEGNQGTYKVEWNTQNNRGSCSCPYDDGPCKHLEALKRTWKLKPGSFLDVNTALQAWLDRKGRDELLVFLQRLMVESPSRLAAWGVVPATKDSRVREEE